MKKFAVIYRGKKVDEIKADTLWEATVAADKIGYNVMSVDIAEIKPGSRFETPDQEEE